MKKRIIAVLAVVLALLLLVGCAPEADDVSTSDERLNIVTMNFPAYDFARQVGGENVSVQLLLPPGMDCHSYEPTPQDIKTIMAADLFIYTGGENDAWLEDILVGLGEDAPLTFLLTEQVELLSGRIVEGMQHEHDHGDEECDDPAHHHEEAEHRHAPDEHVWTSPVNVMEIVGKLAAKLAEIDPANGEGYLANATAYQAEIAVLDADFRAVVNDAERRHLLFGDRFPFLYFAECYGLEYFAAFPGCAADVEPSAATVAFLIDKAREEQFPVVFNIEFSNGQIAAAIAEGSGAEQLLFHSCHNVTRDEMAAGATYISLMRQNLENLKKALN